MARDRRRRAARHLPLDALLIDRSKRIRKATDIPEHELRRVLDACGGEPDAAAAELEVSRRALKLRISELGWDGS